MQPVEGVLSVASYASQLRLFNEGYNEGNPKMSVVPIDTGNYAALVHRDRPHPRPHAQGLQHDGGAPVPRRPQGHDHPAA